MLPPCNVVRVGCKGGIVSSSFRLPAYTIVRSGLELGDCRVYISRPSPCIVTPLFTMVSIEEWKEWRIEELRNNVLVEYRVGNGNPNYLIYPKSVWERVEEYVSRLASGSAPPEPGLLLYGPPGTGKTSMVEMLASILSVHVVRIEQHNVLSKWVGESEKRLASYLDEAEDFAPTLIVADEGEWILSRRSLVSSDGSTTVMQNLVNELLRRMQRWKNRKEPILFTVATNASINVIDQAFLRSGRFGKPLLVPLPDYEAVRKMLELMGVDEKIGKQEADRLARKLVALGANMSDVVAAARSVIAGRKPNLQTIRSFGYKRFVPVDVPSLEELREFGSIIKCIHCEGNAPSNSGRYYLNFTPYVGTAIAAAWLLAHGYTPIVVYEGSRIDEAVHTAELGRNALILVTSSLSEAEIRRTYDAGAPLVFVGPVKPSTIPVAELTIDSRHARKIGAIIKYFYGIDVKTGFTPEQRTLESMIVARLRKIEAE